MGFQTLEEVIGASEVAGLELTAALNTSIAAILQPVLSSAAAIPMRQRTLLAGLPCHLGANIESRTPDATIPASLIATSVPPPTLSHVKDMPSIRNQHERGTCVAFASLATYEHYLHIHGASHDLSEQFLYWDCKNSDGHPNEEGTWVRVAFPLLQRDGCCTEGDWSYVPNVIVGNEGQGPPPAGVQRNALAYRMAGSVNIPPTSILDIKNALNNGRCVTFSIPVYNSWFASLQVRLTGDLTMPIPGEVPIGGHAMCMVGYDDMPNSPEIGGGRFIIRNSWDVTWGANSPHGPGYGTIPYLYIARSCMEAFSIS
jgi:C1A family cysteine protease